jgi:aspartate ammonia-lyase
MVNPASTITATMTIAAALLHLNTLRPRIAMGSLCATIKLLDKAIAVLV